MPYAVGDPVRITRLRKKGRVAACLKGGRFKVLVGSMLMDCPEKDLEPDTSPTAIPSATAALTIQPLPGNKPIKRVDLHGMTATAALDHAAAELNRAVLSGMERLEIMHGLGSGRLREALHAYLTGLSVVKRYKLAERNPGVTIVYL